MMNPDSKNKPLSADAEYLLNRLRDRGEQLGWDWQSDYRFAEYIGNEEMKELIGQAIHSTAPFVFSISAWKAGWDKPITQRRIRALRELVAAGLATSYWVGLGEGSMSNFGATRTRAWSAV